MLTFKSRVPYFNPPEEEEEIELIELSIVEPKDIELIECSLQEDIPMNIVETDSDIDINLKDYIVSHGSSDGSSSGGGGAAPADCNCNLKYTNAKVEQNVGNVKIGESFNNETIQQVLDRIFAASYTKPSISIGLSCRNLYDKDTESLNSVTITANVTKKSEKISYVKFYVGGTLVQTLTTGVSDGGIFKYTYTPATPIQTTTVFKVETCDETTKSVVSSQSYVTFVQKSYWGSISSVLSPTDLDVITLLTNGLKTSVSMSQTFTAEYGRFIFAYPKAIGSVKSIKDNVNNFNYTDSCSRANLTINGGAYEVIYLTDCAGFDGVTITFA